MDKDAKVKMGSTPCDRCKCEPATSVDGKLVRCERCARSDGAKQAAADSGGSLGESAVEFADKHENR